MFDKQLKVNIKELDVQIGKLSKELDELEKDNKYDTIVDKLKVLIEARERLAKSQGAVINDKPSAPLLEIDKQIESLTSLLEHISKNDEYSEKMDKLEELTKVRCQLSESKVKNSVKPLIVSGLFGVGSVLMVLKNEQTEIITSKAFNIATSMFRRV